MQKYIKDTSNRKQMAIKRDLKELGICYKEGENFIKSF